MVDPDARRRLGELIRHLAAGLITNREFEKALPKSADRAVFEVFFNGAWMLYSDLRNYKLIGDDKLDRSSRPEIARWVLFLETSLPHEWPVVPGWVVLVLLPLNLCTFGLVGRLMGRHYSRGGDLSVWPFWRRVDYEAALQRPAFSQDQP